MSDITITFPAWATPLLIGVLYWPVLLVAALGLAGLGAIVHGWFRAGLFGLATIALLPCLVLLALDLVAGIDSVSARRAWARTHETLTAPLQIQGLNLPAGTEVTWVDERRNGVMSVELPGPTPLLGAMLTGKLENLSSSWWSGTLAADTSLDAWPCRAGDVWLSHEGRLMRCTLAADHEEQGLEIPAGSEIALAATGRLSDLRLPEDRTTALSSIGAALPAGGSLFLRPDGAIERAYVAEPGTLRVSDMPLRYEIRWVYPELAHQSRGIPPSAVELRGDLAADTTIDGTPTPMGSLISVDLASGATRVARPP
jgi:hypothetical protein